MSTIITPETRDRLRHLPPEERARVLDRSAEREAMLIARRVRAAKLAGRKVTPTDLAMWRRCRSGRYRTTSSRGARPTPDQLEAARDALHALAEARPDLRSAISLA